MAFTPCVSTDGARADESLGALTSLLGYAIEVRVEMKHSQAKSVGRAARGVHELGIRSGL
jgi:hypothetical protein